MRAFVQLATEMPLEDELLARRRTVRALDTADAIREGVPCYVAAESFAVSDEDAVTAWVTRVSHDHWLVREFPDRFEAAWEYPGMKPLFSTVGTPDGADEA